MPLVNTHRHQVGAATAPARQFAQQAAAEGRVVEVVEHLLADASGTLDETVAVAAVHRQQAERGEVTEHLRQLRMQRRPVEYRQVETERRCLAPATDGLGEGCQGHAGSAQAVFAGARAERLPGGLVEARVEVPEARGPGVRLRPQRQAGRPGSASRRASHQSRSRCGPATGVDAARRRHSRGRSPPAVPPSIADRDSGGAIRQAAIAGWRSRPGVKSTEQCSTQASWPILSSGRRTGHWSSAAQAWSRRSRTRSRCAWKAASSSPAQACTVSRCQGTCSTRCQALSRSPRAASGGARPWRSRPPPGAPDRCRPASRTRRSWQALPP